MPQAQTYQSEFTGLEMDARFTAVAQLTAALEALTTVVAQKYVKPASGIPSTDMDADVQAALAKANTAVQSLADYYTKSEVDQLLAAINGMDYVDVAALPTASADTLGKIYLVGPDASGYYAYYYTSYDGSAYSWVGPLGTTQISLSNYATKAELSQLDQKVIGKVAIPIKYYGAYLADSGGVGSTVNINSPVTQASWQCLMASCSEGDTVIVTGTGGASPRLWAFVDEDYKILEVAAASVSATNLVKVAPANTAFVIINDKTAAVSYLIYDSSVSELSNNLREFENSFVTKSATNLGEYYLKDDGTVASSSSWSTFIFKVKPGERLKIQSWINSIGSTSSTKMQWVLLSKALAPGGSYSSSDIVAHGAQLGGTTVGKTFPSGFVVDVLTVPSHAVTLLVSKGDGKSDNPEVSIMTENEALSIDLVIKSGVPQRTVIMHPGYGALLLQSCAKVSDSATIQFRSGYAFQSPAYVFGGKGYYRNQQWRVPCIHEQFIAMIPTVTGTIDVKNFTSFLAEGKQRTGTGLRLDAHLGFQGIAPENSLSAFEYAAMFGYPACIANPIASANGTFYCYHDGDAVLSYNGARTSLSGEQFAAKTDTELADYTVIGSALFGDLYNEPIPTVEQFFEICGRTGMRPVFSTHPDLTVSQWGEIKKMLIKYNLLGSFTVKSFSIEALEDAFSVFGDNIDGYIYDVSTDNVSTHIEQITAATFSGAKRVGIEYQESLITEEICDSVIEAGYFVSIWNLGQITGQRYYDLAAMGVTEIVDDSNPCAGLNY